MRLKNSENLKSRLKKAAAEKNEAKRGVRIAAVIAEALRQIGQDPVLVGGAAVEFYSEGEYTTKDIDMVAPGGKELWEVMEQLGFAKRGKDFIHEDLEIYVEFPGEALGFDRKSDRLDVDGLPLQIISLEDLIVDRLCSYKFWRSEVDGLAALLLLEVGGWEMQRLKAQAAREEVTDALEAVQNIYESIVRKKLSKKEASLKLGTWLHHSLACKIID